MRHIGIWKESLLTAYISFSFVATMSWLYSYIGTDFVWEPYPNQLGLKNEQILWINS